MTGLFNRRSLRASHSYVTAGLLLAAVGCAQDPAFVEVPTDITADQMRQAESDASREGRKGSSGEPGTPVNPYFPGEGEPVVEVPPNPTPTPGTGNMGPQVVLNFTQPIPKVDILWVVDGSGSMNWAQTKLREKFQSFASALQNANVDFQVGVTSADACQINWSNGDPVSSPECPVASDVTRGQMIGGKMVGPLRGELVTNSVTNSKIMLPGSDFVNAFKDAAYIGTGGSGVEHGLTAAKLAIQKSQSGVNGNFIRGDAFLSVIVLSDEEDDGIQFHCEDAWGRSSFNADGTKDLSLCKTSGNSPYVDKHNMGPYALMKNAQGNPLTSYKFTADNFVEFLNDPVNKGPGKFRVSAITGVPGADGKISCGLTSGGPREMGTNYIKAANLTSGVVENICNNDWSATLANIGQNTVELASKLPLGDKPYGTTLEVFVNDVKLSPTSYTFDANGNYLVFKDVPTYGSQIRVVFNKSN